MSEIKMYKFVTNFSIPDNLYGYYDKQNTIDELMFLIGKPIKTDFPVQIVFNVGFDKINAFDCLPTSFIAPVINNKTADILQKFCADSIQLIPAIIIDKNQDVKNKYWIVNILESVESIDLDKSRVHFWSNSSNIKLIDYLVFRDGSMINDKIHLAREKLFRPFIIVSEKLKREIEMNKITGCMFLSDKEYNEVSF